MFCKSEVAIKIDLKYEKYAVLKKGNGGELGCLFYKMKWRIGQINNNLPLSYVSAVHQIPHSSHSFEGS